VRSPFFLMPIGLIATLCLTGWTIAAVENTGKSADAAYLDGVAASSIGNFTGAVTDFESARDQYLQSGEKEKADGESLQLAAAYEGLGDYLTAITALQGLPSDLSPKTSDELELAMAQAMILSRSDAMGDSLLDPALQLVLDAEKKAAVLGDSNLQAQAVDEQGDLLMSSHDAQEAVGAYQRAFELAKANNPVLATNAASNAAVAALTAASELKEQLDESILRPRERVALKEAIAANRPISQRMNDNAAQTLAQCPLSRNRLYLKLTIGQTYESLAGFSSPPDPFLRNIAYGLYREVIGEATATGDTLAAAYGYGLIGRLYESEGAPGHEDAMRATRAAVFRSQQVHDVASLYRWQWQMGQLLDAEGRTDDAIDALKRSIQTLSEVRKEIASGGGNVAKSFRFRDVAEGPFYELADLLLRRAENQDFETSQTDLQAAQDVIEDLKTTQLQNYLGERCDALFISRQHDIKRIDANTVVVYFVPLENRTVILLGESEGDESTYRVHQLRVSVSKERLFKVARNFRAYLRDSTSFDFAPPAEQLYDWLIAPIQAELAGKKQPVKTLVFIPDGMLRTIPMAAMYDRNKKQFLVEQYAIAVSPGLKLNPFGPSTGGRFRLLANGVSEARLGFAPLPSVPKELSQLQTIFGKSTRKLLDKDFLVQNFDDQLESEDYSIIHISSHGEFAQDSHNSFILAYDHEVDLNHLQMDIEPNRFKGRPVDLLTLSCCETAAGDDLAALGLAGVAVKAGARSALASLWSINDEAAAALMPEFYRQLTVNHCTKAQALMAAQLKLLKDPQGRLNHPAYWAPFILVGDWR
jgi:CHAT domain-containing protein